MSQTHTILRNKGQNLKVEPSKIDFVIYHANCRDGFGAAWSAWKLLGSNAEYFAACHGDLPPSVKGKNVAILDFSYDRQTLHNMAQQAKSLVVIDHHVSAMKELAGLPNVYFDMSRSGAMLAWNFFHAGKDAPTFIKYIEDRDLWKWNLPLSKEFSAAFELCPYTFQAFSEYEKESTVMNACKRGKQILAYSDRLVEKIASQAVLRTWRSKTICLVNSCTLMSEVGNKLAARCDFAVIWFFDHKKQEYRISLRSCKEHIDCSEIAKKFGGGGHKKAAGFSLSNENNIDEIFCSD